MKNTSSGFIVPIVVIVVLLGLAGTGFYLYSSKGSAPETSTPVSYCSDGTMDSKNLEQVTICLTQANSTPSGKVASIRLQGDLLDIMENGALDANQMLTWMTDKSKSPEIRAVALKGILALIERKVIDDDFILQNESSFLGLLSENEDDLVKIAAINYLTRIYYGSKLPLNRLKLHEEVNNLFNNGSVDVSKTAFASIWGNLPVDESQKKADLVTFVSNYKKQADRDLPLLLNVLYILKSNKIPDSKITEATNFVCSLDKTKLDEESQRTLSFGICVNK